MNKSEAVRATKNANTRLKPVADICLRIVQHRATRPPEREQELMLARLGRELSSEDEAGPILMKAVNKFWKEFLADADGEKLYQAYEAVYSAVRAVQSERWKRLEVEYGSVSHFFDGFGQIKPQYRAQAGAEVIPVALRGLVSRLGNLLRGRR